MFGPHTEKVFSNIQSIAIIKSDYGVYQFVCVCSHITMSAIYLT